MPVFKGEKKTQKNSSPLFFNNPQQQQIRSRGHLAFGSTPRNRICRLVEENEKNAYTMISFFFFFCSLAFFSLLSHSALTLLPFSRARTHTHAHRTRIIIIIIIIIRLLGSRDRVHLAPRPAGDEVDGAVALLGGLRRRRRRRGRARVRLPLHQPRERRLLPGHGSGGGRGVARPVRARISRQRRRRRRGTRYGNGRGEEQDGCGFFPRRRQRRRRWWRWRQQPAPSGKRRPRSSALRRHCG